MLRSLTDNMLKTTSKASHKTHQWFEVVFIWLTCINSMKRGYEVHYRKKIVQAVSELLETRINELNNTCYVLFTPDHISLMYF